MTARPLTWRKPSDHPSELSDAEWVADGIGGKYAIQADRICGFVLWWAHDEFTFTPAETVEAAQALAEADWQQRFADLSSEEQPSVCERSEQGNPATDEQFLLNTSEADEKR